VSARYLDERAFADKVMARVSKEPTPSVSVAAVSALRQLSPRLLFGVSWTAWHLATARTAVVRPQLRFKSAALLSVMLLTLAMGTTFAAAGAVAVVEQVAQNLPTLTGPHRPNPSQPANRGGVPPFASHEPGGKRADPSAAPAGAQPSAGVGEPHPSASPAGDGRDGNVGGADGNREGGNGNGEGGNGKGQGDGNNGGGQSTHPSPTPVDDGQGDNHGGGQNPDGGDDSKGNAGSGGDGVDHRNGGQDSNSGSQDSGNGGDTKNGNNGVNGNN
jgi:hypothetical protein